MEAWLKRWRLAIQSKHCQNPRICKCWFVLFFLIKIILLAFYKDHFCYRTYITFTLSHLHHWSQWGLRAWAFLSPRVWAWPHFLVLLWPLTSGQLQTPAFYHLHQLQYKRHLSPDWPPGVSTGQCAPNPVCSDQPPIPLTSIPASFPVLSVFVSPTPHRFTSSHGVYSIHLSTTCATAIHHHFLCTSQWGAPAFILTCWRLICANFGCFWPVTWWCHKTWLPGSSQKSWSAPVAAGNNSSGINRHKAANMHIHIWSIISF